MTKEVCTDPIDYTEFVNNCKIMGHDLQYYCLGLGEESGEVLGKVKKRMRGQNITNEQILLELGDALWYLTAIATELGFNLADVIRANKVKLLDRHSRGRHIVAGEGDNR